MAVRNIIDESDQSLYKKSREVEKFDQRLFTLLDDMKETLKQAEGIGLAAVQVGVLRRVAVVDVGDSILELINPQIISKKGIQKGIEGCLSCPGKYGITRRPKWVKVRAQDRNGNFFETTGEDLLARAFCHEIDHLDGILFLEHVVEMIDPEKLEK